MRGIELEAHYASAHYHATLSWTRSRTSAPAIEFVNLEYITALPDRFWTFGCRRPLVAASALQAACAPNTPVPTEEGYDFFQTPVTGGTGVLLDSTPASSPSPTPRCG